MKLDQTGAPIDPAGVPYLLTNDKCEVKIDPKSEAAEKR